MDAGEIVQQLKKCVTAPNNPGLIFNSPPPIFYGGSLLAVTPATEAFTLVAGAEFSHTHIYTHKHTNGHKCTYTQTQDTHS